MKRQQSGFTLIEILAALAVVAIAVVALIRLHLMTLSMADQAQTMTRAVLLAEQKIADVEVGSVMSTAAVEQGTVDDLQWQRRILPVCDAFKRDTGSEPLRQVEVDVQWRLNGRNKHYMLTTIVDTGKDL